MIVEPSFTDRENRRHMKWWKGARADRHHYWVTSDGSDTVALNCWNNRTVIVLSSATEEHTGSESLFLKNKTKPIVITVVIWRLSFGHKISCDVLRNLRTHDYPAL